MAGGKFLFGALYGPRWPFMPFVGRDTYATARVQCVAKANLVDGDDFTITDGFDYWMGLNFEFHDGAGGAGDVEIALAPLTTAQSVAAACVAAINAQGASGFGVRAMVDPSNLTRFLLFSRFVGPLGNAATVVENVADAGFVVAAGALGAFQGGDSLTDWLRRGEQLIVDADRLVDARPGWHGPRPIAIVSPPGWVAPAPGRQAGPQ